MKNNLTEDNVRDIAIRIVDELVKLGYVPDCIDTDDDHEFIVQDIIVSEIEKQLNK
jgi:hypothetical protein